MATAPADARPSAGAGSGHPAAASNAGSAAGSRPGVEATAAAQAGRAAPAANGFASSAAPAVPLAAGEPEDGGDAGAGRRGRDNPALSLAERWRAVIDTVRDASIRHSTSLMNARLAALRPGEVVIGFAPDQAFHRMQVTLASGKATVEAALTTHFGRPTRLVIDDVAASGVQSGPTLAEQERQGRAARERSMDEKVRSHPAVRTALKVLGGELEHIAMLDPEPPPAAAEAAEEESA